MADCLLYEVSDGLATLTLNRPDALNALNTELKEALREAVQRAAQDPAVRAVLLTGSGRAFCVGQDLKEHVSSLARARGEQSARTGIRSQGADNGSDNSGNYDNRDKADRNYEAGKAEEPDNSGAAHSTDPTGVEQAADDRDTEGAGGAGDAMAAMAAMDTARDAAMDTVARHYTPITATIAGMPKPVVAAVNGVAAGAGAGFAFAADYRVVAETATFHTAFAGVALSTDSGVCWTLPRLIGRGRATDLLLFPRAVSAAEALELGIAQRVVPPEALRDEAEAVARQLAQGPTVAYAAIKEALEYAAGHSLAETLAKEGELQARAGASEDHHIAVDAFVRKEQPRFVGR